MNTSQQSTPQPLPPPKDRVNGVPYLRGDKVVYWRSSDGRILCEHQRNQRECRDCGGAGFCEHGRLQKQCKECGGRDICEHMRKRSTCKECGGSSVCEHKRQRSVCKECGGSSICQHNRQRALCKECGGKQICPHRKQRQGCVDCGGGGQLCHLCRRVFICNRYKHYCAPCYYHLHPELEQPKAYRTKEKHLFKRLLEDFPDVFRYDRQIDGGCSGRRPDVFSDRLTHVVIGENDEEQHRNVECENKRTMQLFVDTGNRPQVIVRFNPDSYVDSDDVKHPGAFSYDEKMVLRVNEDVFEERYVVFKQRLEHHLHTVPDKEVTVEHLFYNGYKAAG